MVGGGADRGWVEALVHIRAGLRSSRREAKRERDNLTVLLIPAGEREEFRAAIIDVRT